MKIWLADELGKIKSYTADDVKNETEQSPVTLDSVVASEKHDSNDYVQIMAHAKWKVGNKSISVVAIARRGGIIELLDPTSGRMLWYTREPRFPSDDMFVALEETGGYLFWCTNQGHYCFLPLATAVGNPHEDASKSIKPYLLENLDDLRLSGPISKARCHPRFLGTFAFGGKERNLEIWRSNSPNIGEWISDFNQVWTAKNVRNDEYDLKQPVWISDLQFLDSEQEAEGYKIVVCTRFHQIRVYHTMQSRRPIINLEVGSDPMVSMVLGLDPGEIIYADSHGKVSSYSPYKKVANGDFAGPTGSILSLDTFVYPSGKGILACVGLDRFLRLYDMKSRKILRKVYCKTKMTSVLILRANRDNAVSSAQPKRKHSQQEVEDADNDSDALWAMLPDVDTLESTSKRRRLSIPSAQQALR